MEILLAALGILAVVTLLAFLVVLVVKTTAATVGPAQYDRGTAAMRAEMQPEIKRLNRDNQQLWNRNMELENRLQIATRQPLALPPNTVTVPAGHAVTVRKERNHG